MNPLSDQQQQDIEALPEDFQQNIASIVAELDENSRDREELLRLKLEELYQKFRSRLEFERVEEEEIQKLLEKARTQIEAFFPNKTSV